MIFNGNQTIDHLNLPPSLYQPLCVCLYSCLCFFGRQSNRHHGIKPRAVNMLTKDSNTELSPNL